MNNVLVRMYDQGIHISVDEYTVFKKAAQLAAKRKQSLLFLPCHKSHIVSAAPQLINQSSDNVSFEQDYLSGCFLDHCLIRSKLIRDRELALSWLCYRLGLSLPHIVAGGE